MRRALLAAILLAGCCTPPGPGPADPAPREAAVVLLNRLLAPNDPCDVPDTDLVVHVVRADMANTRDEDGNTNHVLFATLEVRLCDATQTLELTGTTPQEWKGYRIRVDYEGFSYSTGEVRVIVER